MNTRANIMYFIEHFLDLAKDGHADYIRMMQRDIIRVVDAVAPDDGSGAANVRVVRKVGFLDRVCGPLSHVPAPFNPVHRFCRACKARATSSLKPSPKSRTYCASARPTTTTSDWFLPLPAMWKWLMGPRPRQHPSLGNGRSHTELTSDRLSSASKKIESATNGQGKASGLLPREKTPR